MKILLIGEYSRLHNSLKEGLMALGHEVTIIGLSDGFKEYPIDILIHKKYDSGVLKKIKILIHKVFSVDITSINIKNQVLKHSELLKGFDIVQLINENSFLCTPNIEEKLLQFFSRWNKNIFLLSCGTDCISVDYAHQKKLRYSILTPLFEGKVSKKNFVPALKFLAKEYKNLHEFIYKNSKGVIASDLDYHIPLQNHPKYLGFIPNPINIEKLRYTPLSIKNKIIIFHGINIINYYKKGNDIFEKALAIVSQKYADKIEIITVKSVPYKEYINLFDSAHILLDQVYSYDQGYNALEAMAKGKVVFTGAEQEWLDWYSLKEDTVCINALPDANVIAEKLEWLILNPKKIIEISKNARSFIEKEHSYIAIAQKYVTKWKVTLA